MAAMPKDPSTLFCYWEVDEVRQFLICSHFHRDWESMPLCLCVYDVTAGWFDGYNAPLVQRINVLSSAHQEYVWNLQPGHTYVVDLSTLTSDDRLFAIVRSNAIVLPPTKSAAGPLRAPLVLPVLPAAQCGTYPYEEEFDGYHIHDTGGDLTCRN